MDSLKRITISACAMFIMLGFVAGGIARLWNAETDITPDLTEEASAVAKIEPEPETREKYILKIEDGIVVVFNEADMLRPIIVTDIYASTLRHLDRERLTEGVAVSGDAELQTMLEDYSS